jgi:hypothetical protein
MKSNIVFVGSAEISLCFGWLTKKKQARRMAECAGRSVLSAMPTAKYWTGLKLSPGTENGFARINR